MGTKDICEISKQYTNKDGVKIVANYKDAVHWLHNSFVLCNNIIELDASVYDNMRWEYYDEENDEYDEVFQWFICDCSDFDVEYLEKRFGLKFTYSDKLDCYVLCVNHCGTSWDYVYCEDYEKDDYWKQKTEAI